MFKKMIEKGIDIGSKIAESFMGKGDIKYLVLYVLRNKPMHGYQIMSEIKKNFMGLYSPSPGTIYPTLQMLDEQGLINEVKSKGKKKVYKITKKGKSFLNKNKSKVTLILKSVQDSKVVPQVKKLSAQIRDIGKVTINLAMKTAEKNVEKVKKNTKKTQEILKESLKKIRKAWQEK